MDKLLVCLTSLLLVAACKGNGKEAQQPAGDPATTVAPKAKVQEQEPDSLFFPRPDKLRYYKGDYEDYPAYFVFMGRFASFSEMKQSPFYENLRIVNPELAGIKGFAVNTTPPDRPNDVWLLVPRARGMKCSISKLNPEIFGTPRPPESFADAESYYESEDMKPILIHTSMNGIGSIVVYVSAQGAAGYDGGNNLMWLAPKHTADGELTFTPIGKGKYHTDPFIVPIPSNAGSIIGNLWWKGQNSDYALKLMCNGQVFVRGPGQDEAESCSYIAYTHKGQHLIAVKSDDGQRRAVWQWSDSRDYRGDGVVVGTLKLRQIKGDILPDDKEYVFTGTF